MGDITEVWGCCMGLSVGVVKISYLDEPPELVRGFLGDLKVQALEGLEEPDEDEDEWAWGGGWGMDGMLEFSRNYLLRMMTEWADRKSVGPSDRAVVQGWIGGLPWDDDDIIMLHIGQ